jgi:hypothetical protein
MHQILGARWANIHANIDVDSFLLKKFFKILFLMIVMFLLAYGIF